MDGHYYSMPQIGGYYANGQPIMPPEGMMPPDAYPMHDDYSQARLHQLHTMSSETLNSYSDLDDPNRAALPAQGASRNKRRPVPGADHIKHRRTRSGCYTCRQRRVKVLFLQMLY